MKIREWLNCRGDYETGRQLYEQFGSSSMLKRVFALGPSPYNTSKLASELKALCPDEPALAANAPVSEPPAIAPKFTDVSTAIWDQIKVLLGEQKVLHAEMSVLGTSKERFNNAARIMELAGQLAPLWAKLDYVKAHGSLPVPQPPKTDLPKTEAQLITRRATLRTYLSRYKNRPDKLEEYQTELTQIEEAIKNVTTEV